MVCGKVRRHAAFGMCSPCWQRHPDRPFTRAERLAARLQDPPDWLGDLVAFLAARHCVGRTSIMLTEVGRLLTDGGAVHPQALLERSRRPGRSMGTLARALQDFFVARGQAVPLDQEERLAAGRRQRRLDGIPEPLRAVVARFADHCLAERERARRAGTRPRQLSTIEAHLRIVRDLGVFLVEQRQVQDWAAVTSYDLEAFLAHHPARRKSALAASRKFFTWARTQRLILIDPARGMTAREPRGFRGTTLTLAEQKALFRRWTHNQLSRNESTMHDSTGEEPVTTTAPHPHEALVGLLCLLHAASSAELRALTVDDVDPIARTVQFVGRPLPTPLDPTSWAALQRCLAHRRTLRTANPHVLVTRGTKATRVPASGPYVTHVLDAVDVAPRTLRQTRLLHLASGLDPKLVATVFGMRPEGVLPYLADRVDPTRLTPTPPPK
ncbi:MAG: site-specific integrase [Kineosporiaceae bacterium]|nr:site-specific integrase [Kineosporiaceae bacterium]